MEKYGFVYIWFDKKRKMYYVGSHWGTEDDGYVCSSKRMNNHHYYRPQDFKRRILKGDIIKADLYLEEQKWLDRIDKQLLGKKYYNLTKNCSKPWTTEAKLQSFQEKRSKGQTAKWADPIYRKKQSDSHWSKNGKTKEVSEKINTKERASKIKGTVQALYDNGYQNPNKGKFWINNSIEEHYIKGDIPEGWARGRIFSEARSKDMNKRWACPVYRQSMSDKHKGKRAWNKGLTKTAHSQ